MATIENISNQIIQEGVKRNYIVVPEFTIRRNNAESNKKVDIAWLDKLTSEDNNRTGSLREWKLIAIFEIEGCDVVAKRIKNHLQDFIEIQQEVEEQFSKHVVLYTKAYHRKNPDWQKHNPDNLIETRTSLRDVDNHFYVQDGRYMEWLQKLET